MTTIKECVSITELLKSFVFKNKMRDNFLNDVPSGLVWRHTVSRQTSCLKFFLLLLFEIPPCFCRQFCVNCVFTNIILHLRPQLTDWTNQSTHRLSMTKRKEGHDEWQSHFSTYTQEVTSPQCTPSNIGAVPVMYTTQCVCQATPGTQHDTKSTQPHGNGVLQSENPQFYFPGTDNDYP